MAETMKIYVGTFPTGRWVTVPAGAAAIDLIPHNALEGLQGGATAEYYHLTSAQATDLTDGGATTLHTHAGITGTQRFTIPVGSLMTGGAGIQSYGYLDGYDMGTPGSTYLTSSFQVPSLWNGTTDIVLKFRWVVFEDYATNNGEVSFSLNYSGYATGDLIDYYGGSEDLLYSGDINIPATGLTINETDFTLDRTYYEAGDVIYFMLWREVLVGGNNPLSAFPSIINVEVEYTA